MAEVLVVFNEPVRTDGGLFHARVCGGIADDGLWEGWIEFHPADDPGTAESGWFRSGRETEQPNLGDLRYWADGLSVVYLQGAFSRAIAQTGPPVTHTEILAATQEFLARKKSELPSPPSSGS